MSKIDYHLGELKIARTVGDPRRIMPALPSRFESILDLGCGIGQTLIDCEMKPETFVCGVDIDAESVLFGKKLSNRSHFICSQGENLPFPDRSFEVVIARVSLPFMHIPSTIQEVARILKPGGSVWFTLHPFSMLRERLFDAIRLHNMKSFLYSIYILVNGICFHFTGRQFRYPLNRKRCESVQTIGAMTRLMKKSGFEQLQMEYGHFFVVTARKRDSSPFADPKEDTPCAASAG